jgi:hypothetical protein
MPARGDFDGGDYLVRAMDGDLLAPVPAHL